MFLVLMNEEQVLGVFPIEEQAQQYRDAMAQMHLDDYISIREISDDEEVFMEL